MLVGCQSCSVITCVCGDVIEPRSHNKDEWFLKRSGWLDGKIDWILQIYDSSSSCKVVTHSWWYHLSAVCLWQSLAYLCLMSWLFLCFFYWLSGLYHINEMETTPIWPLECHLNLREMKISLAPKSPALTFMIAWQRLRLLSLSHLLSWVMALLRQMPPLLQEMRVSLWRKRCCMIASLVKQFYLHTHHVTSERNESCIATWWNIHLVAGVEGTVEPKGLLIKSFKQEFSLIIKVVKKKHECKGIESTTLHAQTDLVFL